MIEKNHELPSHYWSYVHARKEPCMIMAFELSDGNALHDSSNRKHVNVLKSLHERAYEDRVDYDWPDVSEAMVLQWSMFSLCTQTRAFLWSGKRWRPIKPGNAAWTVIFHKDIGSLPHWRRLRAQLAWRFFLRTITSSKGSPDGSFENFSSKSKRV